MNRSNVMQPADIQALINYYLRRGYYQHVIDECETYTKKFGDDPIFVFWLAFSFVMTGSVSEGVRCYMKIKDRREIQIAALAGLIHAQHKSGTDDSTQVEEWTAVLEVEAPSASDGAKLQLSLFYSLTGDLFEAKKLADEVKDAYSDKYVNKWSVKGWTKILDDENPEEVMEKALQLNQKDVEAQMGMARHLEKNKEFKGAVDCLNKIIVNSPNFVPALVEKMRLLLTMGEWEQCFESATRIINQKDDKNIDAIAHSALYYLVKDYNLEAANKHLQSLVDCVQSREPRNDQLCYKLARTFGNVSLSNPEIIQKSRRLIEMAKKSSPDTCNYFVYQGFLELQMNEKKRAEESFNTALLKDDTSLSASLGSVETLILENKFNEAVGFIDILNEVELSGLGYIDEETMEAPNDGVAELTYLNALISWRQDHDLAQTLSKLDEATRFHLRFVRDCPLTFEYYADFNPTFVMKIINEYSIHCPEEPLNINDPPNNIIIKMSSLLDKLNAIVQGVPSVQLISARVKHVARNFSAAQDIITRCLNVDPTFAEANLLSAQISLAQENFSLAQSALQKAVSNNFSISEWPSYCLLKARVFNALGEFEEALTSLNNAVRIIKSGKAKKGSYDYVLILLEKAVIHSDMGQKEEASSIIEELLEKHRGSSEEGKIIITNAKLSAKRGDSETALNILSMVRPKDANFSRAKLEMANIHLNLRGDRKSYMKCFEELLDAGSKTSATFISLGEAYMNIQEPEQAIKAFENALELDINNSELRSKIGKAMVTTHCYEEAIVYYQDALDRDPNKLVLRHDLADLYFKLKQNSNAEKVLSDGIQIIEALNQSDINNMINLVKSLLLISKARQEEGKSLADLIKARSIQKLVLQKIRASQQETLLIQKRIAANICYDLGKHYQDAQSIEYFSESLEHDSSHEPSMLALADIYIKKQDLETCQSHCYGLLRIDPEHELANMMLADIMFRRNNFDEAIEYFGKLMEKKPNNYHALVQLIKLLRRAGCLEKAETFIKNAENATLRKQTDAGLHYCNGLYQLYSQSHPRLALKEFNLCRNHPEYAEQAVVNMINIYLSPDNAGNNNTAERDDKSNDIKKFEPGSQQSNVSLENIQAAEALIETLTTIVNNNQSINKRQSEVRLCVLKCSLMLAKNADKSAMEQAVGMLTKNITEDIDSIPILMSLSSVCLAMKQPQKARSNLKRIIKLKGANEECADDFEKALLLLAEIQLSENKIEHTVELLKQALQSNESCARAWELLGLVHEKEQDYNEASISYGKAWKFTNEFDPNIGFKLAFNLLKAKKSIECIDVCHKVLASHPDYPKIRKEVLEKARVNVRS
ncbi:tetratricopeptide repeat protein [Acrasis kona]|uniref:Tetratricopeptide repeat protein n=1 Tax=Acrasis kona TaxID=1008807 RepID=A0AAW2YXN4_9EUKA